MTYGLRVWNGNGQVRMDTDTWTFRVARVEYIDLPGGGSVSFTIPGLTAENGDAFVVPAGLYPLYVSLPVVDVIGETVTVRASQKDRPNTSDYYDYNTVPVYLYVVFFQ